MPKKIHLKTHENKASVTDFIANISDDQLRKDAKTLLKLFKQTTGWQPKMWGGSIVGFGKYAYKRSNGDEGEFMATGFSPRKSGPTLYIMPGYADYSDLLSQLGPHKLGKSCLYLKSFKETDRAIITKLIKRGLKDLAKTHTVTKS